MNPSPVTWALVSDGGKARILSMKRHPPDFREVLALDSTTRRRADRDLVSDASGRSHHVTGPGSHVREPRVSAHDQAEERFVAEVLETLSREAESGSFDSLVVAADPRTLGKIRNRMDRPLRSKLKLELNLDLTGLSPGQLEKRMRQALNWPPA